MHTAETVSVELFQQQQELIENQQAQITAAASACKSATLVNRQLSKLVDTYKQIIDSQKATIEGLINEQSVSSDTAGQMMDSLEELLNELSLPESKQDLEDAKYRATAVLDQAKHEYDQHENATA